MFCFIMALKSKQVSSNWDLDCRLLSGTLSSILNQQSTEHRTVVVCHERPDVPDELLKNVEFIDADWEPPPKSDYTLGMRDKWKKLGLGLVHVGRSPPEFVMLMDADDLVSKFLVSYCLEKRKEHGFVIKRGYNYVNGSNWILCTNQFNCGTNAVIGTRHFNFPLSLDEREQEKCLILRFGHTIIESKMAASGTPLSPVPFHAGIYLLHSGNASLLEQCRRSRHKVIREWIANLPRLRLLTSSVRREFGMDLGCLTEKKMEPQVTVALRRSDK